MSALRKRLMQILVLAIACSLSLVPSIAEASELQQPVETISFDEYFNTLKEEYAKRGVEFEILGADDTMTFTTAQLEEELSLINDNPITEVSEVDETVGPVVEPATDEGLPSVARTPMPYNKTYHTERTVSPKSSCSAKIRFEVSAVVDAQYDTITSINGCSTFRTGNASNFYSWTQYSARAWKESSTSLAGSANGQVVFHEQAGNGVVNVYAVNLDFGTCHWNVGA